MPAQASNPGPLRFRAAVIRVTLTLPTAHNDDLWEETDTAHDILVDALDAIERKIREEVHEDFEIIWDD